MTQTADLFMGREPYASEPRTRLASYLRQRLQREGFPAKRLSKAIGCTPKAAENILDEHWPNSRHWQRIVQLFGRDVLDAVFGPDIDETVARLRREESELERLLAEKRERRRAAEGVDPGDQERMAPAASEGAARLTLVEPPSFAPKSRGRK